ncbi:MAG: response regulator [Candidatus Omnitrophica bacterium]|nr:response regulator [Candidatus Omnitrophota bacterium]
MPNTILIVDDDTEFREEFKEFLYGYEVLEASNGREALERLRRANTIDLVILDVNMPGLSGIDVLAEIKKTDPELGIIILTGYSSKDVAIEALKGHADDYIEKPLDPVKTRKIIERVLETKEEVSDISTSDVKSKIEKVKRFVERNCFKKTTLEDAAKSICLSPKYLSRIFKEQMHKSFSQFKLGIKIEKSKKLLQQAGYNINQIAEKLGYENAESFIRQFKKFTGSTPTGYRKKTNRTQTKKE